MRFCKSAIRFCGLCSRKQIQTAKQQADNVKIIGGEFMLPRPDTRILRQT